MYGRRTIDNSVGVLDTKEVSIKLEDLEDEHNDLVDGVKEAQSTVAADPSDENANTLAEAKEALADWNRAYAEELDALRKFVKEGEENSSWRDGKPLVRESHWNAYARQLVNDCDLPTLPACVVIDWEATAERLQDGWVGIEWDGVVYFIEE